MTTNGTVRGQVFVTLKPGVLDPQGKAVEGALRSLGYEEVHACRQGKFFELEVAAAPADTLRARVDEMCRKLLANPIIEQYRFETLD